VARRREFPQDGKRTLKGDAVVFSLKEIFRVQGKTEPTAGRRTIGNSTSIEQFYRAYFGSPERKCVIQVGANDGVMCDPLRRFLARSRDSDIRAVLIEPIPFYYAKLQALYADFPNISVIKAACGAATGTLPLFFIDPEIADQMNGDGPANDWAHGQGSFDRDIIAYWIERNKFRGADYVKNMSTYHASIRSIETEMIRLADIEMSRDNANLLVVIDVQGFELDVIRGIDWSHPPAYIIFEDDMRTSGPIDEYLSSQGYTYVCGRNDRIYAFSAS
jgi:FkbM family methyltransferase